MAASGDGITLVTGETRMYSIGDQVSDTTAMMIATVMDGNGRALADGIDDVDSTVTFSYEYASGSDLKPSRRMVDSRTVDVENNGTAKIELDDWKTGEKAVRLTVSAMYSGPTGDLDLGEVVLSRTGPADSIEAVIYNFDCVDTGMNTTTEAAGILDDTIDMKADDCAMDMRFGVNQMFIVDTKVKDALGSVKSADTVTVDLPDDDDVLTEAEHGDDSKSPATDFIVYTVGEKAPLGMHMVTVTHTSDDVDDVELMFYVAGPPAIYMIEGSSRISLNGSETYVVTALDANDGIPYFEMAKPTVEIFIQGLERGNTRYLMTNETELGLDPDTGEGSFAIYAPPGTMDSATIRIFVGSGDIEQEHVVMFGMNNLPMGADIADVMMTMGDDPMMVEAMFTDADGQDLTYEWMSSDEMVATVMADDMDMSMASITAVGAGEATITVTATDSEGGMGMQTFMVTVMMAPVVPLGQAMDLTATANADGSITLMFTPGTSATHHFVSGNVSVIWEYAGGMNMHTVPADQLTSGMEYKFYVLSGQWEEMADGTWEGMWAAEGWSNVAMSTAN